eukprot:scpid77327/ scgid29567/ 
MPTLVRNGPLSSPPLTLLHPQPLDFPNGVSRTGSRKPCQTSHTYWTRRMRATRIGFAVGQQRDTPFHQEFKAARSNARAAIDTARVDWIKAKAQAATDARFNGAVVWKCIHDLQSAGRGLQPLRTAAIVDENGNICTSPREQGQRWGRHFSGVLNVMSTWTPNALNGIPKLPLAEDPTLREVC